MIRILLAAAVVLVAGASPAKAVVVYQSIAQRGFGQIVAARDDGSSPRVIAHGETPVVAPNGREVAYFVPGRGISSNLRVVPIGGGRSRLLARGVTWLASYRLRFQWSANSRYIVVSSYFGGAVIVDVKRRLNRRVRMSCAAGPASFDPDSTGVAIEDGCDSNLSSLVFAGVNGGRPRAITDNGQWPAWGRRGLAFRLAV